MTTTKLTDAEVKSLQENKKLKGQVAQLTFRQERLQDKIASLTLALQAAHKGIARTKKKSEYYRQNMDALVTLIQKSDYSDILFKNAPRDYDGAKPGYKRPPTEDKGIQVSDTASGKGTIRFDFGRG